MSSTNKILISGYKSGFGKYAYSKLNKSKALNRDNRDEVLKSEYKTIIHSAFSSNRTDDINDYYDYVDSNILLTNDLVKCRHERFIYISSLAVHDKKDSLYKRTKLMAESIVKNKSSNYLIVRVPAMLGTSIRPNTVTKMIKEKNNFNFNNTILFAKYAGKFGCW